MAAPPKPPPSLADAIHAIASRYVAAGLSIVPIRPDGTKRPTDVWKEFQHRLPSAQDLRCWFIGSKPPGIAVICGKVSGGLEVLDFDDAPTFFEWAELIKQQAPGLLDRLPIVRTPGEGFHVYYRIPKPGGNHKLAERPPTPQELAASPKLRSITLIETRGEGGYVLAPGCPPSCHETGGVYTLVSGPDITQVPLLDRISL